MDVAGERPGAAGLASAVEAVPGFYVALELLGDGQCCRPGLPFAPLTLAVVRATATGAALAAVTAPSPYGTFIGVTAAADNRTFVLATRATDSSRHSEPLRVRIPRPLRSFAIRRSDMPLDRSSETAAIVACSAGSGST